MTGWHPQEPNDISKEAVELVNKEFWQGSGVFQAYNRNRMIQKMADEIIRSRKETKRQEDKKEFYASLLEEIWNLDIHLRKDNPITKQELKGCEDYERRLLKIFSDKVSEICHRMHVDIDKEIKDALSSIANV